MADVDAVHDARDKRPDRRDMLDVFLLGMSAGLLAALGLLWAFEPQVDALLGKDPTRPLPVAFFAVMGAGGIGLLMWAVARTFRREGRDELHRAIDRQAWIVAAFVTLGITGVAGVVQMVWDFHLPLLVLVFPMLAVFIGARLIIQHRYTDGA